jgi:FKBP-type peptidyl-prolyl cis-trans isomerase
MRMTLVLSTLLCSLSAVSAQRPPDKLIITMSGLQYVDLLPGVGKAAKKGDEVAVAFGKVQLKDGTEVKSLLGDRAKPFKFTLGGGAVIQGFNEGVTGMKPGGKRKLVIPARLAYGNRAGADFPPNSDLIMELELVGFGQLDTIIESKK